MKIRTLKANEIEARVQIVKENGCSLLLYKDARCDMKILDEVFGPLGWEREHQIVNGNLFCTVRVWDEKKSMWVAKQDVGTESYTEKEKGQASDSFKRACFNLGIGRELYTAPFIWIKLNADEVAQRNGKTNVKTKFKVEEISYNEHREIEYLLISDEKGNARYTLGTPPAPKISKDKVEAIKSLAESKGIDIPKLLHYYNVGDYSEMNESQWSHAMKRIQNRAS